MLEDFTPVVANEWLHIAVWWNKTGMFKCIVVFAYLVNLPLKDNKFSIILILIRPKFSIKKSIVNPYQHLLMNQ